MKLKLLGTSILLAICGWLLLEGWCGERGLVRTKQKIIQYYQCVITVNDAQKKNANLHKEIRRLKDNKFWIEKHAREKLGWVKPGEVIYKFETVKEQKD